MPARPGPSRRSKRGPGPLRPSVILRRLARDRRSGASALADQLLEALGSEWWGRSDRSTAEAELATVISELPRAQPAMGAFLRWADQIRRKSASSSDPREWLPRWAKSTRTAVRAESSRLLRAGRRALPPRGVIVTLSRSSSVREVLTGTSLEQRPREVRVLVSRPGGEGKAQAADLRHAGLSVRLMDDREAGEAIRGAGLVLLGADALLPNGDLVHKVGTRDLVRRARRRGVPVIALVSASRRVRKLPPSWRLPRLFDRTPASWFRVVG